MGKGDKQLLVVGDRVLIKVEEGDERSKVGLYLPATAVDNQAVQGGTVVATGPGTPSPRSRSTLTNRGASRGARIPVMFLCRRAWATTRCFSGKRPSRSPLRPNVFSWYRRPQF